MLGVCHEVGIQGIARRAFFVRIVCDAHRRGRGFRLAEKAPPSGLLGDKLVIVFALQVGRLEGLRFVKIRYRVVFKSRVALGGLMCPWPFAFRIARCFRGPFLEDVLFFTWVHTGFPMAFTFRFSDRSPFVLRAMHPKEGRTLDSRVAAPPATAGGSSLRFRFRFLSGWYNL